METIYHYTESRIRIMQGRRKYETAKTYQTVLNHLKLFSGNQRLLFADLTADFLIEFGRYLSDRECCNNTRQLYFRQLQTLHRQAAKQGVAPHPDDVYDVVLADTDQTIKRNVAASVLKQVRDTALPQQYAYLAFARDLFLLAFYLRGIPYIDLAYLKKADIKKDILCYRRHKTGKSLTITIEPCALAIINRWRNRSADSPYLFPIIKHPGSDDDERRQYESGLRLHNVHLKKLAQAIGLPQDTRLTSYTPRHTWVNLACDSGVSILYISEALSHSSEKTTRCYIDSFTVDRLAGINRQVVGIIDQPVRKERVEKRQKNKFRSSFGDVPVI